MILKYFCNSTQNVCQTWDFSLKVTAFVLLSKASFTSTVPLQELFFHLKYNFCILMGYNLKIQLNISNITEDRSLAYVNPVSTNYLECFRREKWKCHTNLQVGGKNIRTLGEIKIVSYQIEFEKSKR